MHCPVQGIFGLLALDRHRQTLDAARNRYADYTACIIYLRIILLINKWINVSGIRILSGPQSDSEIIKYDITPASCIQLVVVNITIRLLVSVTVLLLVLFHLDCLCVCISECLSALMSHKQWTLQTIVVSVYAWKHGHYRCKYIVQQTTHTQQKRKTTKAWHADNAEIVFCCSLFMNIFIWNNCCT